MWETARPRTPPQLQAAIDECGKAGAEQWRWKTGALCVGHSVSDPGWNSATLPASIADYPGYTYYNRYVNESDMDRCFVYAEDAENIALIDGNAACFPNEGSPYRPMMIRFLRCRHVRLEDLRLYDSPAWTTAILGSEFIHVRGLDIRNSRHYNGDALDFDGCRHVFVSGCRMNGTDDNLCLQASSKDYSVENVPITDCLFTSVCAGIRIGLKSVGDIRDVVVTNCTFRNVWREEIKIECTEGGAITDIMLSNLRLFQNSIVLGYFCQLTKRKKLTAKAKAVSKPLKQIRIEACWFDSRLTLQAFLKAVFCES
jgi:polygalacturonase